MDTTTRISAYRNLTTGELAPSHLLGTDENGRGLYVRAEGWEPVEEYECDADGNWMRAREVAK